MLKTIKEFPCDLKQIEEIQQYISSMLQKYKVNHKTIALNLLTTEEILFKFIENKTSEEDKIRINIKKRLFQVYLKITCPGKTFDLGEIHKKYETKDKELQEVLTNLMSKVLRPSVEYIHKFGINKTTIPISLISVPQFSYVIFALIIAVPFALLLKNFVPQNINTFLINNIFDLFDSAFLKILKFLLAPIIFLSIASSIASISDLSKLGKIAVKISLGYIATSIFALFAAMFASSVFSFKNKDIASIIMQNASTITSNTSSIKNFKDTILGIIPPNVIAPFLNTDMLQLIFFAIIFGVALSTINKDDTTILRLIENLNTLFMRIISKVVILVPLYVFFSISTCIIQIDLNNFFNIFVLLPATLLSFAIMLLVYSLIMFFIGKINPLNFFKKASSAMVTAFSLSSSNATIPETLKCCKKLGISDSIYTFSIPFGATINMDGAVTQTMVATLLFMELLNVHLPLPTFIAFCASLVLLSAGMPGIPNAQILMLTISFNMLNMPLSAIPLVVAISSIIEMFGTMINVTGDMAMTTTVASTEKMLDLKKFNS